jgi:acetyltransferase-like isoleucine patch superfamily enzyme
MNSAFLTRRNLTERAIRVLLIPLVRHVNRAYGDTRIARFQHASEFVSVIPFVLGTVTRRVFYERTLKHCGRNFVVRHGAAFVYRDATLGDDVFIGRHSNFELVSSGSGLLTSSGVSLLKGRHHWQGEALASKVPETGRASRIHIGDLTWVGTFAVVIANVNKDAVIGAGSAVVHVDPDGAGVMGNPGRIVKKRSPNCEDRSVSGEIDR